MYKIFESKSGTRYLYESISNHIFQVDDESYKRIESDQGETRLLRTLGDDFWFSIFPDKGSFSSPLYHEKYKSSGKLTPKILVLELTQQCNFRCKYCIYSGAYKHERQHSAKTMTHLNIDQICDKFFQAGNSPEHVSFYGGEPLLRFDLIKYMYEKNDAMGFHPHYALTTNGSLLRDSSIRRFFIDRNFNINISYDGVNHDLHRKPNDNHVSSVEIQEVLHAIKQEAPSYFKKHISLSATLAPPYNLLSNAEHFMSDPLLCELKIGINTVNEENNAFFSQYDMDAERMAYQHDLKQLLELYISSPLPLPPFLDSLFGRSAIRIEDREMSIADMLYPPGQCEIGIHRTFITATGELYMCERVGSYGYLGGLCSHTNNSDNYHSIANDFSKAMAKRCPYCYLNRICDMCLSTLREGNTIGNDEYIDAACKRKREWYDMIFYAYLTRKEHGFKIC